MRRADLYIGTQCMRECTSIAVVPSQPLHIVALEDMIYERFSLRVNIEPEGDRLSVTFPVGMQALDLDGEARRPINAKWIFEMLEGIEEEIIAAQEQQERLAQLLGLPIGEQKKDAQ